MSTSTRGFASMSKERLQQITSMGGKKAHELGVAHEWTTEEAKAAGSIGGKNSKRKEVSSGEESFETGKSVQIKNLSGKEER